MISAPNVKPCPLEKATVTNMWEIPEAVKLEYGVGSRASARVRLGSDPSLLLRMTMGGRTEGSWLPADELQV
jgi:hypothetical protein